LANLDSSTSYQKVKLDKFHEKWGEKPTLHSHRPPKKSNTKGSPGGKRTHSSLSMGQLQEEEQHVAVQYLPSNALVRKERGEMF